MQHIQPCSFCGGIVKVADNHWRCTRCGAEWTLGMRLLKEGTAAGAALDAIFGPGEPAPETLCVDTLHQVRTRNGTFTRCRLRIYRCEGVDVVILTELADNPGMSVTNAIEELAASVSATYALDETAIFIEHYEYMPPTYDLVELGGAAPTWRRLVVEEVERLTGAFFCDSPIAEYSELC